MPLDNNGHQVPVRRPNGYNVALATIKEQYEALLKKQHFLQANQKAINAIHRRFDDLGTLLPRLPDVMVEGYDGWQGGYTGTVIFSLPIRDLAGFKDEKLEKILETFVDADEMSTTDCAEQLNRDFFFTFKLGDTDSKIKVSIYAYAKQDNPTCRKVLKEVKQRVVEDKVYEIVCDDQLVGSAADYVAPEQIAG
jgi:hypothetical protein